MAKKSPLPPIVFSHANSFPAGTYRLLFELWRAARPQTIFSPGCRILRIGS